MPALDDRAVIEHHDAVGLLDRRQAMRNDERRAIARQLRKRRLDAPLGVGIERRGGLIQNQDRRILQDRARDRDALPLAAREQRAAIAHQGVEPLRQLVGKLHHVGGSRRILDRLRASHRRR